jgi:hypothetical protein
LNEQSFIFCPKKSNASFFILKDFPKQFKSGFQKFTHSHVPYFAAYELKMRGHCKNGGDVHMSRLKKNPSKAGVSAASVKGNAGPSQEADLGGKKTSQNQQYKKNQ